MTSTYVRKVGDGRVYQGAAIVHAIVLNPDAAADYVDVYDGLDATGGEKVLRIIAATATTTTVVFPAGVRFSRGVYLDAKDGAVETTVFFQPLEL